MTADRLTSVDIDEISMRDLADRHDSSASIASRDRHRLLDEMEARDDELRAGDASDGHHTHNELYDYRLLYNAAAANAWAETGMYPVVRSWKHSDGELCFDGGWFVVVATLPTGQIANHYQAQHWDLFSRVPAVDLPPEYDGHTPADAADRLRAALVAGATNNWPDRRPHSRACGPRKHDHGTDCHPNCLTCGGTR